MQRRIIEHKFQNFIIAALQTAAVVTIVNILWYLFANNLLEIHQTAMSPISILLASIVVSLLAAIMFYFIFNRLKKPVLSFRGICFILAIFSLATVLKNTLPDGSVVPENWPVLVIPMHILTGIFVGYFLPKFLKGDVGAMFRQTA